MKKVAMIGVGKLGQDCAEVMADAGYHVLGYDVVPRTPSNFEMRSTIEDAVKDRDLIFIAAPTPHDPVYGGETPTSHLPNKDFDYAIVTDILKEVNKYVNQNQLVVLISTVLPGTVRSQLRPCITNARFIYNPYLIAMGTIKWDMVNPEMVIIGTDDGDVTHDAKELIDFYKVFMQNDPRYEVGTWDEAESIKIFYNTFISTKIALVNMIQDVAEVNGNINVDVVTNALAKSNYRITGPAYMKAAFGDAGACHPRDNIALRYLADRLDLGYDLFDAIMTAREVQAERMALRCLKNGRNVTIVGKAYKPGVPYTNGSASMLVGYYIEKHGGNLNYYDPNTEDNDLREDWTQVYLIGYWESWVEQLQFKDSGAVVIDPWRMIKPNQHSGEIIYYGDTRPAKTRYVVPDSTVTHMLGMTITMFPGLNQYKEAIHLIDATINSDTTFVLRPTEDLVKEIVTAKQNGKSKFIFFACTEAFMPHVTSKIQRLATILDGVVNENDIFMITTVPDADNIYSKLIEKNGWNKKINLLNCNFFNYITTTYAQGYEYIGGYDVRFKGKLFTCFNKQNREHRINLLEVMLASNLIAESYYSFEGGDDLQLFQLLISQLDDQRYPFIKMNADRFPIRLNITENRTNPVNIQPDDLIYYKDSYFSVITETLFYDKNYPNQQHRPPVEDSIFLTEKTYRCFAMLHPFILMARPHSLRELRNQGFKTFMPFIDESYDLIEDDVQRFDAIQREIKRLCNLTGEDWQVWQAGIKEIVEYNHRFFHDNTNFVYSNDYLNYFADLTPNSVAAPAVQALVASPVEIPVTPIYEYKAQEIIAPPVTFQNISRSESPDYHSNLRSQIKNADMLDWRNKKVVYENGLSLHFPNHVDGGGDVLREDFISLVERTGKSHYTRALDWCSGHGPFGFDLLDKNKADHVVFQDCYNVAIETCLTNAIENNIPNRVTGYVLDQIANIPLAEKFDLVVANPPHCNSSQYIDTSNMIDSTIRIIVDHDYTALQEFFKNIRSYLTSDADVYITSGSNMPYFVNWALLGGLKFIGFSPLQQLNNGYGGTYHFKVQL